MSIERKVIEPGQIEAQREICAKACPLEKLEVVES